MELILISSSKLKIMLSPDDMREHRLCCDSVDYGNTETRRAFWSILDEAKQQTGFDAASSRVYIQLYPSRSGGCELYVTKLLQKADERRTEKPPDGRELTFRFEGVSPLLCVCRRLSLTGFDCSASAYFDEEQRAWLCIFGVDDSELDRLAFISEFGEECDPPSAHAYIDEHGHCICTDSAVERLAGLA